MSGDWWQTLPVVPGGGRAQEIASSMFKLECWKKFQQYSLTKNFRLLDRDLAQPVPAELRPGKTFSVRQLAEKAEQLRL